MKKRFFLAALATVTIFSQTSFADDTELGKQMDAMNDAYKAFRREEDPAKGAALALEAQQAMIKAVAETPELLKDMPDGPEKTKALANYRRMMGLLISNLAEIEIAFLDGDLDKVKELIDVLRASKKEGHNKFIEE
ncbi:MAG: cytochrome b562 [Luteolibacter sp.]